MCKEGLENRVRSERLGPLEVSHLEAGLGPK